MAVLSGCCQGLQVKYNSSSPPSQVPFKLSFLVMSQIRHRVTQRQKLKTLITGQTPKFIRWIHGFHHPHTSTTSCALNQCNTDKNCYLTCGGNKRNKLLVHTWPAGWALCTVLRKLSVELFVARGAECERLFNYSCSWAPRPHGSNKYQFWVYMSYSWQPLWLT